MRVLILSLIVFLTGMSQGFAAKKSVCPDIVDYVTSGEPDSLGGPGGRPRGRKSIEYGVNMPHGQLNQSGTGRGPSARYGDERISSDYGPYFDEAPGSAGPLF